MMIRPLFIAALFLLSAAAGAQVVPFSFVHFSDPHIGGSTNSARLIQALQDVDENFPDAAFIIITGDCTEFGFQDQLTSYVETLRANTTRPVYSAPGNHDSRWSDSGKENFRETVGPTYQSFDHNGVRFILMDSSMLLEQYAHFSGEQLARLEEELRSLPSDHPAVIAMHHPPLAPKSAYDNDHVFADLISRYNVPLVLTGHGHAFQRYARNGTTYAMGSDTYGTLPHQSGYAAYSVTTDTMLRTQRRFLRNKSTPEEPIPTQRSGMRLSLEPWEGETPERLLFFRALYDGDTIGRPCTWSVDQVLTGTSTGMFALDPDRLPAGLHHLVVEVDGVTSTIDVASVQFLTEPAEPGHPRLTRTFPLQSGCQSHPAVDGDILYVGANDGLLRAIDLTTSEGNVLWQVNLHSEIVSAPVVTTETVVLGSMNSMVYCLDKITGAQHWKFQTGTAVFASPLVADDTVYIGSGDGNMYALDLATGAEKWRFAAEAHIKATPVLADSKLFFGAWDNWFYCVNAADGRQVWRVPVSVDAPRFSAATCNPVATDIGTVIVCSHDYSIRSFDQKTGAQTWIYKPAKDELGPSYSTAVIKDEVAYFGSIGGRVVGHDINSGGKVFNVELRPEKTDAVFDSLPLLRGDKIYVGSVGGNLYCVDIPEQKVAWSVALQPGFIFTRPAWWNNHLLVGSMADKVFEVAAGDAAGATSKGEVD